MLEVPSDGEEDGSSLAVVLVVIKKPSGVLLAVPEGFFGDEALEEGMTAGPDDMMGPSRVVTVDAGRLENMDGSPPVAEQGAQLRVLLIDMTPGILGHLSKVADYAGPPEILHLLDPDPFRFPMRDDLVAAAWDWLVQPDAGDRIHYYSAAEELEEEDPEQELVPEASGPTPEGVATPPGHRRPTTSGRTPKPAPQPKMKRPTVASLAASFESVAAALPMLTSQLQELSSRTKAMEERMVEPTRTLALTRPLGDSTMAGSSNIPSASPLDLLKEMPPPQSAMKARVVPVPPTFPEAEALALEGEKMMAGDQGGHVEGDVCTVFGCHGTSRSDCKYRRGFFGRLGRLDWSLLEQRCNGPHEVAAGVIPAQGDILHERFGQHESKDESSHIQQLYSTADDGPRSLFDEVCGEVRGVWTTARHGLCHVASSYDNGLSSVRELGGSSGCHSAFGSLPRANGIGQLHGCGVAFVADRGSALGSVHEPFLGSPVEGKSVCPTSRSKVDHDIPQLYKGARPHRSEEDRCGGGKVFSGIFRSGADTKAETKAEAWVLEEEEVQGLGRSAERRRDSWEETAGAKA